MEEAGNHLPTSRFWPTALVSAIPCATVPFVLLVLGYGAYARLAWFFLIPLLIIFTWILFASIRVVQGLVIRWRSGDHSRPPPLDSWREWSAMAAFLVITGASWLAGIQVRTWYCESICEKTRPLIEALERYRAEHGSYPTDLQLLAEFRSLNEGGIVTVRQGRNLRSGIDVGGIDDADVTFWLDPHDYLCVVPLEKRSPMSFSRFYILRKDSHSPDWTEDHLIWYFSGS